MLFKEIIGQKAIIAKLLHSAQSGRIPHAQLFTGALGSGGLPVALAYAQYLNCPHRTQQDSCGVCPSCVQMQGLVHPDVHFVFPVNKSKVAQAAGSGETDKPLSDNFIGAWRELFTETGGYFDEPTWYRKIDLENKQGIITKNDASEIIKKLSFKSFQSEYKILLIWLPERMNDTAANTLLKIIEEPWDKTLFLLVSEAPDKIIATVRSRTQQVHLPSIENDVLTQHLIQTKGLDPTQAAEIARLSFGDYLRAQTLITETESEDDLREWFRQLLSFSAVKRHLDLFEWAETIAGIGRERQKNFFENGIRLLRECYLIHLQQEQVVYSHGSEHQLCSRIAPYIHAQNLEALVSEFETANRHITQNGNPRIVLTHFALTISKLVYKL